MENDAFSLVISRMDDTNASASRSIDFDFIKKTLLLSDFVDRIYASQMMGMSTLKCLNGKQKANLI